MIAEFIFTVTESKFLIAKAVTQLDRVQKAFREGIIAMHPSTSTYYVMKELTGQAPDHDKVWITGMIVPKALCVEAHTQLKKTDKDTGLNKALADAGTYPHTYVLRKGERVSGWVLNDLTEKMGVGDIYLKGVNAMDASGKVAVQIGSVNENGTIGRMIAAAKKNHFEIICPTGMEKLIPGSAEDAARFVNRKRDYSMGVKSALYAFDATVLTEKDALEMLADIKAMPFSCGGLDGAEGAVCIAVEGSDEQVQKAIAVAESVKGVKLPTILSPDCMDCSMPTCYLCGTKKPWVV